MTLLRPYSEGFTFWCPGCAEIHSIRTQPKPGPEWQLKPGPTWSFNGNMSRPTFSPSVRHFDIDLDTKEQKTTCHYFIKDGFIEYCGDCEHALSGHTVPMQPIPEGK